jgi:hypothetical protein
LEQFYQSVKDLTKLHVLVREDLSPREAWDWDDSKLVIFTTGTDINGEELHRRLLEKYRIQMEMVSGDYVLGMTSIMDTQDGFLRLSSALHEIDNDLCKTEGANRDIISSDIICAEIYQPNPRKLQLTEAMERPWIRVPLTEAVGQVMADYIYLYPPGIPLIVPGEVVTEELTERFLLCMDRNLELQGGGWITEDCIFLKTILY